MKQKKIKPLGNTSPWVWVIEPTHGCNLKCGHCSCRLLPNNKFSFMKEEVWINIWKIISKLTPTCKIDLALSGEPTLHPNLLEFLRIARQISPLSQLQVTTNGTMLLKEKVNYASLLNSGANIIYTDMYGDREKFKLLAKASKFPFYEYYNKPDNAPSPWTYTGGDLKLIVLQEQPENWPKSRFRAGLLGTWMNHLDWKAAEKFNIRKVIHPPFRRCNQPFLYVPVSVNGDYLLCCQDNWHETENLFGNVKDGIEGFKNFWYGEKLQKIRKYLREKERSRISYCSRCSITFSRCDFKHWTDNEVNHYWNGKEWRNLK